MKTTFLLALAISSAAYSQANFAGSINDTYTTGDTLTAAKLENIKTAVNDNDARSLPDGVTPGDLLYWNGSVWNLTPASIACSSGDANLKLIAGVPTWTCSASTVYKIGDMGPAGGNVFYVTAGGRHGLEVATNSLPNAEWGCEGTSIPGAFGRPIGTGQTNTDAILADCPTPSIAARVAAEYLHPGTLYNGWFMPSIGELLQLCQSNKAQQLGGGSALITLFSTDAIVWSSTDTAELIRGPDALDFNTCTLTGTDFGVAEAYRAIRVRAF